MLKLLEASLVTHTTRKLNLIFRARWGSKNETFLTNPLMTKQVFPSAMVGILIKFIVKSSFSRAPLTCILINDICTLNMSGDCFNAGLIWAQFLEKRVICLKVQPRKSKHCIKFDVPPDDLAYVLTCKYSSDPPLMNLSMAWYYKYPINRS